MKNDASEMISDTRKMISDAWKMKNFIKKIVSDAWEIENFIKKIVSDAWKMISDASEMKNFIKKPMKNTGRNATVKECVNYSTFDTLPRGRVSACVSHLLKTFLYTDVQSLTLSSSKMTFAEKTITF